MLRAALLLLLVTAVPGLAQTRGSATVRVLSCPRADSLLGPLTGSHRELRGTPTPDGIQILLDDPRRRIGADEVVLSGVVIVPPVPNPTLQLIPAISLVLTGYPTRLLGDDGASVTLILTIDTATTRLPGTVSRGVGRTSSFAGVINAGLSDTAIARLLTSNRAQVAFDRYSAKITADFRQRLSDAMRLNRCGYSPP